MEHQHITPAPKTLGTRRYVLGQFLGATRFAEWIATFAVVALTGAVACGQITQLVAQVSQTRYEAFHQAIENMGLGLYGGPAYDMGYRNRNGHSGPGTLGNQEARLFLQDTFSGLGLEVTTQGRYRNVIGELPGRTTPERIYIIGGHYDHISGNRPGGDDNASGTAAVLEAARVLSSYQFDSTIRFIGFNAEEDGLLGSRDYVNSQALPNQEQIAGMVNLDMILRPGWDSGDFDLDLDLGTRTNHSNAVAWARAFEQAAADYVPSLVIDSTIFNVAGGSDQDAFVAAGYPAVLAIENTAEEIWNGSNAYYHGYEDASDRLANDPFNPSGVTYDYVFATDVTRSAVGLIAQEAGLLGAFETCDLNRDGDCDVIDLNTLLGEGPLAVGVAVRPGVNDRFDLNEDGALDNADVDHWLAAAASLHQLSSPYNRGDANLDGVVDVSDFNTWNQNKFTETLTWDHGNFNGDAVTDGSDFNVWNTHRFTASGAPITVAEPYSRLPAMAYLLVLIGQRLARHPGQRAGSP